MHNFYCFDFQTPINAELISDFFFFFVQPHMNAFRRVRINRPTCKFNSAAFNNNNNNVDGRGQKRKTLDMHNKYIACNGSFNAIS